MKTKLIILLLTFLLVPGLAISQSGLDDILQAVEQNNKSLKAHTQFWETRRKELLMGLTLPNPQLEFEYLFGSPAAAGNQTDFTALQSFELPSVYQKRKELARLEGSSGMHHTRVRRQDILLEAKEVYIQIIYNQKLKSYFGNRVTANHKLVADFQKRLDQGDGTILEVNKAKLQLLQTEQSLRMVNTEIQALHVSLTQLNGGETLSVTDTVYPFQTSLPDFETLEEEIERIDPERLLLEQEKRIAKMHMQVSKFRSLPNFELGYRHQGILGQQFNGLHTGVTIPLWEQKNVKQYHQADLLFRDLQIQDHVVEHYHEIKRLYEETDSVRSAVDIFLTTLDQVSDPVLLDKALALGEITIIEYFLENSFYQSAYVNLLELERNYQLLTARLLKYRL